MNTVNGFTIIAHKWSDSTKESYIILCANYTSLGYEYVTAHIQTLDSKEWFWGHYFHSPSSLPRAYDDFMTR